MNSNKQDARIFTGCVWLYEKIFWKDKLHKNIIGSKQKDDDNVTFYCI